MYRDIARDIAATLRRIMAFATLCEQPEAAPEQDNEKKRDAV